MAKRALLIGCQTYGLLGVNGDVELMAGLFTELGFEVRTHIDGSASREELLDAYEQLILDTEPGSTDPVVVYYSGHGGRQPLPDWEERQRRGEPSHLRFLVPTDMPATTSNDFRGILAEELSALQRRLTAKTENVTAILDCCHAATMSRAGGDPSVRPKAIARDFAIEGALRRLEVLEAADGGRRNQAFDDSNPSAVRIVACDPLQSAFERVGRLGTPHGVLTEHLVLCLRELGDRTVTWRLIGDRIRREINARFPMQRPEVEGPAERVVFSLERRRSSRALPVSLVGDVAAITGAGLFGVSVGDTFQLLDADEQEVGRATVDAIEAERALLTVHQNWTGAASPVVSAAPLRTTHPRVVHVDVDPALAAEVTARLDASVMLRTIDRDDSHEPLASIVAGDAGLIVRDADGVAVRNDAFSPDPHGVDATVALVERMAKAERLRALASTDASSAKDVMEVELALHVGAERRVVSSVGERFRAGDRVSVTIVNTSPDTLYVALIDIHATYDIILLNNDEPSG